MSRLVELYVRRCSRLTTSGRVLPEVDGLRFVAILTVLLYHCQSCLLNRADPKNLGFARDPLARLLDSGAYGVHFFFVISGFILALPFAGHALANKGPVSLGRYYRRRLTRLEPPYLLCLLLFFALKSLLRGQGRELLEPLLTSSLYVSNVVYRHESLLNSVTWSLEIEVQFYLLMPLLAMGFALKNAALRRALWIGGALAFSLLDAFVAGDSLVDWTVVGYLPFFLVGLLLADLYVCGASAETRSWWWDVVAVLSALAIASLLGSAGETLALPWLLGVAFISLVRGRVFGRLLRMPVISTTGGMCYSIYLLHWPLIGLAARLIGPVGSFTEQLAELAVVALPMIWVVSVGYFLLVERPCMDPRWPGRVATAFRGIVE